MRWCHNVTCSAFSQRLLVNRCFWCGSVPGQIDLLRNCTWSFSSVYWRLFSPPCQHCLSCSWLNNSWAASLQPAAFCSGEMGSSCWKRGSPGQLRAVPLPSMEQGIPLPCCEGLQEQLWVCGQGRNVSCWCQEEFQNSDVNHGLPGTGRHAEDSMVKGWPQQTNQSEIPSLHQSVVRCICMWAEAFCLPGAQSTCKWC